MRRQIILPALLMGTALSTHVLAADPGAALKPFQRKGYEQCVAMAPPDIRPEVRDEYAAEVATMLGFIPMEEVIPDIVRTQCPEMLADILEMHEEMAADAAPVDEGPSIDPDAMAAFHKAQLVEPLNRTYAALNALERALMAKYEQLSKELRPLQNKYSGVAYDGMKLRDVLREAGIAAEISTNPLEYGYPPVLMELQDGGPYKLFFKGLPEPADHSDLLRRIDQSFAELKQIWERRGPELQAVWRVKYEDEMDSELGSFSPKRDAARAPVLAQTNAEIDAVVTAIRSEIDARRAAIMKPLEDGLKNRTPTKM